VYRQLAGILQQELGLQYPDLVIHGENYNPGGGRVQLSQLIGLLKFVVIGMVMASFNPWTRLGSDVMGPTPGIVTWAMENKYYACLMTFFLCNMVETQLISSGAFEVTVNGDSVWSKLETGGAPQPGVLLNLVRDKLKQHTKKITEQVELDLKDQL